MIDSDQLEHSGMLGESRLRATGFMAGLPHEARERLIRHGTRRYFRRGALIQQRGDRPLEFWYVESGSIQVGRYSADGKLTLFALLGEGETFGELAFMGEFPRAVDAIAGSDCTLISIGESELQNLMVSDRAVTRLMLKTMALTVQEAFNMIEASRNLSVGQRLAQALIQLCGDQGDGTEIGATQQDLADLIGVSRVSLGKELSKLQQSDCLERQYGRVKITNKAKLIDATRY